MNTGWDDWIRSSDPLLPKRWVRSATRSLPVFRTMALDTGTSGAIVTANFGATPSDGCCRVLLKRSSFQAAEMSGRQFCGAVAIRT